MSHWSTARRLLIGSVSVVLMCVCASEARAAAPPTVAITSPTAGTTVKGTVTVTAQASAATGDTMSSISFSDGVNSIGTASCQGQPTCTGSVQWHATDLSGQHTLTARADTRASQSAVSAPVTVAVVNPAPTVAIVAPAAGSSVKGTVQISLNGATDPALDDYPTSISVYDGVNSIGSFGCQGQQTCAGTLQWHATGLTGAHTLTARISTHRDNSGSSAPVALTVLTPAPTVSITAPKPGRSFRGGSMRVSAAGATDPALDDYPTAIEIYDGKNEIGSFGCQGQTTCSGSITWNTAGLKGRHTLAAVIRTHRDASGTSKKIVVGRAVRVKAKVSCRLSKRRLKLHRSMRGDCTVPGAPRGTKVTVAYRGPSGALSTLGHAKTGSGGKFNFHVTGSKAGTYRLVVIVSSNSHFLRTTVSVGTLRVVR